MREVRGLGGAVLPSPARRRGGRGRVGVAGSAFLILPSEASLANLLEAHAAALAFGLFSASEAAPPVETPEEAVSHAEAAHHIKAVIGALPERERAAMERHYYGGETFDAVAEDLGISKSWASRLHERAIQSVRRALVDGDGGASGPASP